MAKIQIVEIADGQKIPVIKAIRNITGFGLKEAKDVADSPCGSIEVNADQVKYAARELQAAGAIVEYRDVSLRGFAKDIKKVMRKAFEADRFDLLEALLPAYNKAKGN